MASPSDPCIPSFGWLELGTEEGLEGVVAEYDGPRATIQASFAREADVRFQDVTCIVAYVRSLSREEAWDRAAQERWSDEWLQDNRVGFYFHTNDYRYDMVLADGSKRPDDDQVARDPRELKLAHPPTPPALPPADWEPSGSGLWIEVDPTKSYPTPVHRVLICEV